MGNISKDKIVIAAGSSVTTIIQNNVVIQIDNNSLYDLIEALQENLENFERLSKN